jgi:cellulose biosynthesis protein BcsQ
MVSTLVAADWFIIPVFPSGYDLKGLELLMRTVGKVRERYNPDLRLAGVLLGNYDRTAILAGSIGTPGDPWLRDRSGYGLLHSQGN